MSGVGSSSRSLTLRSNKGLLRSLRSECSCLNPLDEPAGPQKFTALWDTGATASCITQAVVDALKLPPTGVSRVSTAGGVHNTNTYLVTFILPHGVRFVNVAVTGAVLGGGVDVLFGMDVITLGDFTITQGRGNTVFSFRVPSATEIDFVEDHKRAQVRSGAVQKVTPGSSFHRKK